MSIYKPPTANPKRRASMRGAVMMDVSHGTERIRKWPEKRGLPKTEVEQARLDKFRNVSWAVKYMFPDMLREITNARQGTPLLPRDLGFMLAYGTLFYVGMPNGRKYYTVSTIEGVSKSLDALTQQSGYTIMRAADRWIGVPLGTAANPWWWMPPDPAGFTLYSGDTTPLTLTYDATRGCSVDCGPAAAGDVLRVAMMPITHPTYAWELQLQGDATAQNVGSAGFGIFARDTISGKFLSLTWRLNGQIEVDGWNGLTGYGATMFYSDFSPQKTPQHLKLASDGANIWAGVSVDGVTWSYIWADSATAFLPNLANEIGFGCDQNRAGGSNMVGTVGRWTWIN